MLKFARVSDRTMNAITQRFVIQHGFVSAGVRPKSTALDVYTVIKNDTQLDLQQNAPLSVDLGTLMQRVDVYA